MLKEPAHRTNKPQLSFPTYLIFSLPPGFVNLKPGFTINRFTDDGTHRLIGDTYRQLHFFSIHACCPFPAVIRKFCFSIQKKPHFITRVFQSDYHPVNF